MKKKISILGSTCSIGRQALEVIEKLEDKFEIIAGERRFKAASLIGLKTVPCIIMNLNDNESAEVAIIENIQRKEMTPLEEAKSFKKLLDKGYLTQEELAKDLNTTHSTISAYESGKTLILTSFVYEIAIKYKLSLDWLCGKID